VHPVTGGRVEAADESFVPYQPAVATTATGESGATPRQSLFSTARLVPHGGLPLIGNSFNSRPPADQAETRSAHAPTPSPQTGQPRPARRSLLTTLRLLNPFDEPK
jgi:hypothetical protein